MSVAIRFERLVPSVFSEPTPSSPSTSAFRPTFAEAPDRGGDNVEAPESYHGRSLEAPDAGESRLYCHQMESHFTHGRSQS
jgi:hypothetical protein